MGFCMVWTIMGVVESAVATVFVIWAEDSAVMAANRPQQYNKLVDGTRYIYGNRFG